MRELSETPFVPTITGHLSPSQCYVGAQTANTIHSSLFIFVDFGNVANSFLTACGARQEPTIEEIARTLLDNPTRYYNLCKEPERYECVAS